ncbi:ATP-binding cassette domain-containing protein [Pseudonocardia sp. HH130630-07]|uniref:ATP-binding cassette domain-containing protein n=1 Tax=Pseudonocardia sp. HH130630-07 TaxID=1690815 RepID=UPI000814DAE7|nr:ATP-binding cassette domain-containing protein [Pseudonocardia sp. HH130630-07]ANY09053.1 ABC transporter [Pseudonocardia sp. HH130630-07]
MGHVELQEVDHVLPDGRVLLSGVSFRVGDGTKTALVGANGTGKTTLLGLVSGRTVPWAGSVHRSGGLGVMPQFLGGRTVRGLLLELAPERLRTAGRRLDAAEDALIESDTVARQLDYAEALAEYGDAGGYESEASWDRCCLAVLGLPYDRMRFRETDRLSGGEQKRLALEVLLGGPDEVLLLDEPDNYLDVPGKEWLERRIRDTGKTVLFVSHDRELLRRTATRVVTIELHPAGNTVWTHGGGFDTYDAARADRLERLEELRRRWDEDRARLVRLVHELRQKASYNDGMASRYQAARTRLGRFDAAGPPEAVPRRPQLRMQLTGGRTGRRVVTCERLALDGLTAPFDTVIHYGDRVAVLGLNGTGKSHFLRLLAGLGDGGAGGIEPVAHRGTVRLGSRVRPGWFAQTHRHPEYADRTLQELLLAGGERRPGVDHERSMRALARYDLAGAAHRGFGSLSGGQQARFQVLLLELEGATLLLLDEPTDNLDPYSADVLQAAIGAFDGTVLAVTHDRWLARAFDRFLLFRRDGRVSERDGPVWTDD